MGRWLLLLVLGAAAAGPHSSSLAQSVLFFDGFEEPVVRQFLEIDHLPDITLGFAAETQDGNVYVYTVKDAQGVSESVTGAYFQQADGANFAITLDLQGRPLQLTSSLFWETVRFSNFTDTTVDLYFEQPDGSGRPVGTFSFTAPPFSNPFLPTAAEALHASTIAAEAAFSAIISEGSLVPAQGANRSTARVLLFVATITYFNNEILARLNSFLVDKILPDSYCIAGETDSDCVFRFIEDKFSITPEEAEGQSEVGGQCPIDGNVASCGPPRAGVSGSSCRLCEDYNAASAELALDASNPICWTTGDPIFTGTIECNFSTGNFVRISRSEGVLVQYLRNYGPDRNLYFQWFSFVQIVNDQSNFLRWDLDEIGAVRTFTRRCCGNEATTYFVDCGSGNWSLTIPGAPNQNGSGASCPGPSIPSETYPFSGFLGLDEPEPPTP